MPFDPLPLPPRLRSVLLELDSSPRGRLLRGSMVGFGRSWFRSFLACECSDLRCLWVCASLGIRAALMSAPIHLKAAQNDFMQ